eukprot:1158777-Pelagomonas_calceolata.AAC.4
MLSCINYAGMGPGMLHEQGDHFEVAGSLCWVDVAGLLLEHTGTHNAPLRAGRAFAKKMKKGAAHVPHDLQGLLPRSMALRGPVSCTLR